jgi:predicted transcriptional regulator
MKRNTPIITLTKAEEDIMHIIWQLERCVVKDIIDQLGDPDMPHSTISSVVRILEKKGFVNHKAYGKTYEYFPIISKDDYAQQGVKTLVEKFFSGSPKQLVSFLVKSKDIDLKELKELMNTTNINKE